MKTVIILLVLGAILCLQQVNAGVSFSPQPSQVQLLDPDFGQMLYDKDTKNVLEYDDSDSEDNVNYVLIPQTSKRSEQSYPAVQMYGDKMTPPVKRNRERTLRQLITLCKKSDEGEDDDDEDEDEDPQIIQLHSMLGKLSGSPVYIKRFGSLLNQQARGRSLAKRSKITNIKRNVSKLKRILMECLMEKNILEMRGKEMEKKPTTQFLRFGRA